MCRHAFFPPDTDITAPAVHELLDFWIAQQGGDGSGVSSFIDGRIVSLRDMKATPEMLQEFMKRHGNKTGWLFHTRMASIGPKVPELVQPFESVAKDWLFTHNGHWSGWDVAFWAAIASGMMSPLDAANDSKVIFAMIQAAGANILWRVPSGIFLNWYSKEPFAWLTHRGGVFAYSALPKDSGIVYGSSFPSDWPIKIYAFETDTVAELRPDGPRVVVGKEPTVETVASYHRHGGRFRRGVWAGGVD